MHIVSPVYSQVYEQSEFAHIFLRSIILCTPQVLTVDLELISQERDKRDTTQYVIGLIDTLGKLKAPRKRCFLFLVYFKNMNTNPNAKTIVCYGDSNTWGDVPNKNERHPSDIRWTGVLQDILGEGHEIVNEGLCGRTFVAEEEGKSHRVGITHLKSILSTNDPVDAITVMLGTNDMKSIFGLTAEDIANHLKQTIQLIQKEEIEKIIVICPAPVINPEGLRLDERLKDAPATSLLLPPLYEKIAEEFNCLYLNAGDFISLENTDGYHLDAEHHKILGKKVAEIIK